MQNKQIRIWKHVIDDGMISIADALHFKWFERQKYIIKKKISRKKKPMSGNVAIEMRFS